MPSNQSVPGSIKETFTSIFIAFVLAFVFRGFVVEAFLIPTGSMAPTLLGQHIRVTSPETGINWPVGPRDYLGADPERVQGARGKAIAVKDPVTQQPVSGVANLNTRGGDRIFVLKYLYSVYDPARFDIVVFKNPNDPTMNYIKRLLGLPGEQVALVDGDVFFRTWKPGEDVTNLDDAAGLPWSLDGWQIARKPERVQLSMWQNFFRSEAAGAGFKPARRYQPPFKATGDGGQNSGWDLIGRPDYVFKGNVAELTWNAEERPITDVYSYNEASARGVSSFPVGDLRVSYGILPEKPGMRAAVDFFACGRQIRVELKDSTVTFAMRVAGSQSPFETLGTGALDEPLPAGKVTNLEFWHADQELRLYVARKLVASARYEWTPGQRLQAATGISLESLMKRDDTREILASTSIYAASSVQMHFEGGGFTLYRLALDRDIFYRPDVYRAGEGGRAHSRAGTPSGGAHPRSTMNLDANEFFFCGDNSPASLDGRLWDNPSPYVAALDPDMGVVHRDLVIGRAFFVYFPAIEKRPVPDFGRMRWIW